MYDTPSQSTGSRSLCLSVSLSFRFSMESIVRVFITQAVLLSAVFTAPYTLNRAYL